MDKLVAVLKVALKSKRFYGGLALVATSMGFATGGLTIDALTPVLCTLAGGCTP